MVLKEQQKKSALENKTLFLNLIHSLNSGNKSIYDGVEILLMSMTINPQKKHYRIKCLDNSNHYYGYAYIWFEENKNRELGINSIKFYKNGKLHNTHEPAYYRYDINNGEPIEAKYFLFDNEYTEDEFERIMNTSGALVFMGASSEQIRAQLAKETKQLVNNIEHRKLNIKERVIDRFEFVD